LAPFDAQPLHSNRLRRFNRPGGRQELPAGLSQAAKECINGYAACKRLWGPVSGSTCWLKNGYRKNSGILLTPVFSDTTTLLAIKQKQRTYLLHSDHPLCEKLSHRSTRTAPANLYVELPT
jgi:hypothetical protein